jgi:hypothetical protein
MRNFAKCSIEIVKHLVHSIHSQAALSASENDNEAPISLVLILISSLNAIKIYGLP